MTLSNPSTSIKTRQRLSETKRLLIDYKKPDDEVIVNNKHRQTTNNPWLFVVAFLLFITLATVVINSHDAGARAPTKEASTSAAGSIRRDQPLLQKDEEQQYEHVNGQTTKFMMWLHHDQKKCSYVDHNPPVPSFLSTDAIINHAEEEEAEHNFDNNDLSEIEQTYHDHFHTFLRDTYPRFHAPGTSNELVNNPNEMTTLVPVKGGGPDNYASFILWGKHDPPRPGIKDVYASAFINNENQRLKSYFELDGPRRTHYISPMRVDDENFDIQSWIIGRTMTVEGDHIVFFIDYYDTYVHILIDMLPFIAHLKETVMRTHKKTKLLLADTGMLKTLIEVWDPVFASTKVSWIDCGRVDAIHPKLSRCRLENIRVDVNHGGSLTVAHPTSSLRHMDYILAFRRWFYQSYSTPQTSIGDGNNNEERFIVYYKMNSKGVGHGHVVDIDQERMILDWIRRCMEQYQRKETLVVFDGSMPPREQVDLFRRTNMVIGGHGDGMANLLYLPEVNDCDQQRPQVLEFITSPQSPKVQEGSLSRTYYRIYNSAPWIEYHHILYTSESTNLITYIDLNEFQTKLDSMFASSSSSPSS